MLPQFNVLITGDENYYPLNIRETITDGIVPFNTLMNMDIATICIDNMLSKHFATSNIVINYGDNMGADSMGNIYAQHRHLATKKVSIKDGNSIDEFVHSSKKAVIFFWNGSNPNTLENIKMIKSYDIPIRIFNYSREKWYKADEIEKILC